MFGIGTPWRVTELDTDHRDQIVRVYVAHDPDQELVCPQCGTVCPGYDKRRRQWRHLDTCQYRTIVVSEVPRVACPEHGVVMVSVPWAKPLSRFTVLFEVLVIACLGPNRSMCSLGPPRYSARPSDCSAFAWKVPSSDTSIFLIYRLNQ